MAKLRKLALLSMAVLATCMMAIAVGCANEGESVIPDDGEKPEVTKYEVTFKNDDGTVLQQLEVAEGALPVYTGETPTKFGVFEYEFNGWDKTVVEATAEACYTATFEKGDAAELVVEANYRNVFAAATRDGADYGVSTDAVFRWNENSVEAQNNLVISNAIVAEARAAGLMYLEMAVATSGNAYLWFDLSPEVNVWEMTNEMYSDCVNGKEWVVVDLTAISTSEGYTMLAAVNDYCVQIHNAKFIANAVSEKVNYVSPLFGWEWNGDSNVFDRNNDYAKCYWAQGERAEIAPYLGVNQSRTGDFSTDVKFIGTRGTDTNGYGTVYFKEDVIVKAMEAGFTKLKVKVYATGGEVWYWPNSEYEFEKRSILRDQGTQATLVNGVAEVEINFAVFDATERDFFTLPCLFDSGCSDEGGSGITHYIAYLSAYFC